MANRTPRKKLIPLSSKLPEVLPAPVSEEPPQRAIDHLLPELPAYLDSKLNYIKSDEGFKLDPRCRKFSEEEKLSFIRRFISSGGHFGQACKALRTDPDTVLSHFNFDLAWQRAFAIAKLNMGEKIQAVSYKRALEPTGVIDRMCQLKRFFPNVYKDTSQINAVQVNVGYPNSVGA